ncbi:MAG: histidine--tRNA ligase [Nitrososphaerota archaeon]|nr:histidine--tRNA ligase [Nitrososphaerota archaeon]
MRDVEPEEYERHARVRRAFEETASIFNFKQMEPATIETLSILRAKSGTEVDKEIYAFKDKGGRDVGLRFDLTVGMTRYVCSRRDLRPPVKLACVGGVWRYDEPQHARYRFHTQWDIEVYGASSIDSDAEVIDFSRSIFDRLGMSKDSVEIGDRRVIQEFISKQLKIDSEERAVEVMRALDKVQKKSRSELLKEYTQKGFESNDLEQLLEFGNLKGSPKAVVARLQELRLESATELAELADRLASRGARNYEYNLSIVRGIDYYTAVVFEVVDAARPDLGSLCGGGRYDLLPKLLGRPELSATGAAGGIDRAALSLEGAQSKQPPLTLVTFASRDVFGNALELLAKIRSAGVRAEMEGPEKPLGKQLEDASAMGARWAVILGKKELSGGVVTLRDMNQRNEAQLPFKEALERMAKGD